MSFLFTDATGASEDTRVWAVALVVAVLWCQPKTLDVKPQCVIPFLATVETSPRGLSRFRAFASEMTGLSAAVEREFVRYLGVLISIS